MAHESIVYINSIVMGWHVYIHTDNIQRIFSPLVSQPYDFNEIRIHTLVYNCLAKGPTVLTVYNSMS